MANVARFKIAKRSVGFPQVPEEEPNTHEYTYVASALDIALDLLSTNAAKRSMKRLALLFDNNLKNHPRIFQNATDGEVEARINSFLGILRHQTPLIVIDGRLSGSRVAGNHPRGIWTGDFNVQAQAVCLNRKLVEDMVSASDTAGEFRRYQFQFACILFHEIGAHLLVTYLYNGRPLTPPGVIALNWLDQLQPGTDQGVGESGRFLEASVFGGTLEFFNTPQVSTAWVVNSSGNAKPVTKAAIDAAVIHRQFNLPYPTNNNLARDVSTLIGTQGRVDVSRSVDPADRQFIERMSTKPNRFFIARSDLREHMSFLPALPKEKVEGLDHGVSNEITKAVTKSLREAEKKEKLIDAVEGNFINPERDH